jgi:hypothetical protein
MSREDGVRSNVTWERKLALFDIPLFVYAQLGAWHFSVLRSCSVISMASTTTVWVLRVQSILDSFGSLCAPFEYLLSLGSYDEGRFATRLDSSRT